MKLIKDTTFKEIYSDDNGVLFSIKDEKICFSKTAKAIIYINGSQLDHYSANGNSIGLGGFMKRNLIGVRNTRNSKKSSLGTLATVFGDSGGFGHDCDWYDENYIPYVFKYIVSKNNDGVKQFSTSLKKSLLEIKKEIILMGKSYGGMVASYAHDVPNVSQIIAVNPPCFGSPLSDPDIMSKIRPNLSYLVSTIFANIVIEPYNTFTWQNAVGVEIPKTSKLKILGGSIRNIKANCYREQMMKIGDDAINYLTGEESDGVVIWNKDKYLEKGIEVIELDRPFHSNSQDSNSMMKICCKTLSMK
jgi:hypothetical protein